MKMLHDLVGNGVFSRFLNLSISASFLVLAVLVFRFLLKKAPKWSICLLWGLVGLRLVFPFSIESVFSLIPSAETVPPDIVYMAEPTINSGITAVDNVANPVLLNNFAPVGWGTPNPLYVALEIVTGIWLLGIAAMLVYMFGGYIFLRFRLRTAVKMKKNIYQSESVSSPFILGMFRPRIYLPFAMDASDAEHVIAHERAHLKRLDHLVKPLAYLILAVYWFNPLLWVAYILLCRDIELACDEKVVREMDADAKKAYSMALLKCSMNQKLRLACPLAFGEVGVKERVKNVMHYKKPAFWIILLAVVAIIVTAVCFLTVPRSDDGKDATTIEVYRVASVAGYADASFITEADHPISNEYNYMIENVNHKFFKQKAPAFDDDWISVGSLVEEKMNKKEMQALFPRKFDFTEDGFLSVASSVSSGDVSYRLPIDESMVYTVYMTDGVSAAERSPFFQTLVDENETVYRIENSTEWLSYLFYQENGDVYWGCGYKEDGLIRGLWRLVYAKSSPNGNIMIPNEDVTECVGFYQAIEDIGSHMQFSWHVGASETPYYYIAENGWLFEQKRGTTDWRLIGDLQEIELPEAQKQLVKLLEIPFMFEDERGTGENSETRTRILEKVTHMWTLTEEDGEVAWSYIFIRLDDGNMFLGRGHDGILRWLYRMERIAEYETYTTPQFASASIVSAKALHSDIEVNVKNITFDDRYIKINASFVNRNSEKEYNLTYATLDQYIEGDYQTIVLYYADEVPGPYLPHDITVPYEFAFERKDLENGKYRVSIFLNNDSYRDDAPHAHIFFDLENLK